MIRAPGIADEMREEPSAASVERMISPILVRAVDKES
jgi:hypothetical protein